MAYGDAVKTADFVKFIRGSQTAYDYLKNNNKLRQDTLYFIYDKVTSSDGVTKLSDTGKLYLGSVLLCEGAGVKNFAVDINAETLKDGESLVYDAASGKWKNGPVAAEGHVFEITPKEGQSDAEAIAEAVGETKLSAGDFAIVQGKPYIYTGTAWKDFSTKVDNLSLEAVDGTLRVKDFNSKFYKFSQSETQEEVYTLTDGFQAGLEPRVVLNTEGSYQIGWYEPNSTTVEGVSKLVQSLQGTVGTLETVVANKVGYSDLDETVFIKDTKTNKIKLINEYVTESVYSAEVGDLSKLNRKSGIENSTIVDEINSINDRLVWSEMDETQV